MINLIKTICWIVLPLSFFQCSDDASVPLTTDLIQIMNIIDVGNAGDASDFLTSFRIEDLTGVEEIRLILVPTSEISTFDSEKAKSLPNGSFHTVTVAGNNYELQLPANLNDANNNAIQENVSYTFSIALTVDGNLLLNEKTDEIILSDKHVLEGNYTGTWNDNLYTDFGISAELKFQAGKLRGSFYYSSNFTSCCGGSDDGMITVTLDGDNITDFDYNQFLDSFMGGECPGFYTGTGIVEDIITLKVDFEGDDCEGPHTDGKIVLKKQ